MGRRLWLRLTAFGVVEFTRLTGVGGVVAVALAFGATATSESRTLDISCPSPSLGGTLPAVVYLPSGYFRGSRRYSVVYFLHGLPANPTSYHDNGFIAQAVAASRHQAIVVAPQGARSQNSDREYLDWNPHEDWPLAITRDLTSCIESRFRTIDNRSGRALIGLSAGGFGAFNIGLRNLSLYGAVESWSGYFAATDPSGQHVLNLGSAQANRNARIPQAATIKSELNADPSFIGFYVGNQDQTFLSWNTRLHQEFTDNGISHRFAIYQGGHSSALWSQWAPTWLGMALNHLAAPQH